MLFKMITSYAGVVALFANNRCLSTVNKIVSFQIRSFNACVAALLATVGLLSTMFKHVCVFLDLYSY